MNRGIVFGIALFRRPLVALLAGLVAFAALVVASPPPPAHAVGADDTIVGPSRVSPAQMAAWFRAKTSSPYRAGVPLDELTAIYILEGARAGVRGDIAFAQSVVETRWFSFPAGGLLTPEQNNFAGIGACDSCATGVTFPTVQLGVRAQMQQLRRYADPTSRASSLGAPPVSQLWPTTTSFDAMNRTHGWAPTWQSLSGTWASALTYAATINQLYNSMWNFAGRPGANVWWPWTPAGGVLTSSPAVASWASNRLDVFVRGTDGAIWHNRSLYNIWSGWESFGAPPVGLAGDGPAAVSAASGSIDVFARGTDNHLWHRVYDGTGSASWQDLGGTITGGPGVASWGSGRVDVFARAAGGDLVHRYRVGSTWQPWESLGGGVSGSPAAASWAPNRLDVFIRGTDGQMWQKAWTGTAWSAWVAQGGQLAAAPAVASWAPGRLDVFVTGSDGGLWHRAYNGTWHAFSPLGGGLRSGPGAVSWAPGRVDVFARGTDDQVWQRYWS